MQDALDEKAEQYELNILPTTLCSRFAFKEAVSSGLSVVEKDGKSKASQEMQAFFEEVKICLK